jgi:hypothetical protein
MKMPQSKYWKGADYYRKKEAQYEAEKQKKLKEAR